MTYKELELLLQKDPALSRIPNAGPAAGAQDQRLRSRLAPRRVLELTRGPEGWRVCWRNLEPGLLQRKGEKKLGTFQEEGEACAFFLQTLIRGNQQAAWLEPWAREGLEGLAELLKQRGPRPFALRGPEAGGPELCMDLPSGEGLAICQEQTGAWVLSEERAGERRELGRFGERLPACDAFERELLRRDPAAVLNAAALGGVFLLDEVQALTQKLALPQTAAEEILEQAKAFEALGKELAWQTVPGNGGKAPRSTDEAYRLLQAKFPDLTETAIRTRLAQYQYWAMK